MPSIAIVSDLGTSTQRFDQTIKSLGGKTKLYGSVIEAYELLRRPFDGILMKAEYLPVLPNVRIDSAMNDEIDVVLGSMEPGTSIDALLKELFTEPNQTAWTVLKYFIRNPVSANATTPVHVWQVMQDLAVEGHSPQFSADGFVRAGANRIYSQKNAGDIISFPGITLPTKRQA
ncbi:MAG: hypothetical protein ABIA93_07470 [Candidatus Woesearchaeota archaeon]